MKRARGLLSIFTLFLVGGVAVLSITVHAQTIGGTDPLTIDITPQYPAPYETITVTPSSTLFDISASVISVSVNGTAFYKGSGQEDIPVPVGGPGTATTIKISAVSNGQTYTKSVTIRPASVALVTEAVSTTHAFYKGAALVGSEGRVRLIALPDLRTSAGKRLDPKNLVYTWKLGDQILQSDSGIGKNVLDATAPQRYRDASISVTVANTDNSVVAQNSTTVAAIDPLTLVYRDDPLLGPNFDQALQNNISMPDTEETYIGIPYYFAGTPTVSWTMNGGAGSNSNDITVRSSGNGQGTAVLNFSASDSGTSQTANSTLSVLFGTKPTGGIFGL